MGKLTKEETGEMEPGRGRETGRKGAEKSRESVEERWREKLGDIRETNLGERERGKGAERWRENEEERGREPGERRDPRSQGELEEEAGKWERRTRGLQGLPEVRGTKMPMWSQPARSSVVGAPRGVKKEEEATGMKRNWGGWPSQSSSSHPPETPPTRLPRMQQEVEPLSSSTLGSPSTHREAGILSSPVCVWGWGGSVGIFFMY